MEGGRSGPYPCGSNSKTAIGLIFGATGKEKKKYTTICALARVARFANLKFKINIFPRNFSLFYI